MTQDYDLLLEMEGDNPVTFCIVDGKRIAKRYVGGDCWINLDPRYKVEDAEPGHIRIGQIVPRNAMDVKRLEVAQAFYDETLKRDPNSPMRHQSLEDVWHTLQDIMWERGYESRGDDE